MDADGITTLKGKKGGLGGPRIPDFMRVEPDEEQKRMDEMKGKLMEALKPTRELIDGIGQNPALASSFEDPEVMAAVDEIAKDPSAMKKYQNNKKVAEFYKAMAAMAGSHLEKMGPRPL